MATTSPFGVLLQQYRLAAGFSQEELAKRSGLSRRGISDLERGERRSPHPATVHRLAAALNLADRERAAFLANPRAPVESDPNMPAGRQPVPVVQPNSSRTDLRKTRGWLVPSVLSSWPRAAEQKQQRAYPPARHVASTICRRSSPVSSGDSTRPPNYANSCAPPAW